jgi:diaminopimelate decarboxylase
MLYCAPMEGPASHAAAGALGDESPGRPWWWGEPFGLGPSGLTLDGHAVADLARVHGTPLYLYSRGELRSALRRLRRALTTTGARTRIYYALKANRFPPLLETLRAEGDVGLDACSPREVDFALAAGFGPDEISVTASMPSNRDLEAFAARGVHVNLDSLSSLKRFGARAPRGTRVGLRLDCAIEVGYGSDPKLVYGNTRFGIAHEAFDEALAVARAAGLFVDTLHVHCGWGLQEGALSKLVWLFRSLAGFARRVEGLEMVTVGGGLGARRRAADRPLEPEPWAAELGEALGSLGVTLACEPGTLLVDRAGLLVVEANTIEEKAGITWLGVDAGHNVNVYVAHYGIPIEIVHVADPLAPAPVTYAVAGNINESNDVFAWRAALPRTREGDLLVLLPAGAYGSSMASDHCLRGAPREVAL